MNTSIINYRVLPKVNSMKNVLHTVEVLIEKNINEQIKSIVRNYTLETPNISTFVNIDDLKIETINNWVNEKIQKDINNINTYFNLLELSEQEKLQKEINDLNFVIEKQKITLSKSEIRLSEAKQELNDLQNK